MKNSYSKLGFRISSFINLLLLLTLTPFSTKACSCFGSAIFTESVRELIIQVEVIGEIVLDPKNQNSYTATALKIEKTYKGTYARDTIYVLKDKGFECFHGIPNQENGKRYIISGEIINEFNSYQYRPDTLEGKIIILDLCLQNILHLAGNKVKGNITKYKAGKMTLGLRFVKLFSKEKAQDLFHKRQRPPKSERLMQRMSITRFVGILEKKSLL